jgi:hypothetical protein
MKAGSYLQLSAEWGMSNLSIHWQMNMGEEGKGALKI